MNSRLGRIVVLFCTAIIFLSTIALADDSKYIVAVGQARFTVITPQCIRLEYDASAKFIDEPSYFAANRGAHWDGAKISTSKDSATIDTGEIQLTYKSNGQPFSEENIHATILKGKDSVQWHPGLVNSQNLGGTERTLDGWDGGRQLSDGLLSRNGWYLLDDSKSVLFTSDWVKSRPEHSGIDWYLFGYGEDYQAALKSLTAIGGPVPMPRRYTVGAWYSRYWPYSSDEFRQIVQEYADHGFPLDVLVMDMDWHLKGWTGYTWNPKLLSDHQNLLDWLHKQGLAVTLNDHPAEGVGPQEACFADFMRAMGKDPAVDPPIKFDAGDKKYLDTFYAFTHRPLEKQGVDFWWLDWQQYPFTRSIGDLTNLEWLNHYNYQETSQDGLRGVSFSRWGGWGSHRYPIQFSGDASTSFKMLAFEVPFTSTAGNVGCFFWSHDIGGHNRGRNEESYARWCQFGAFSAALRSHSTRDAAMDRRPWKYAQWAQDSMQQSFGLRARFFPYLYTAMQQACADSIPFIRPMYLQYPSIEAAYHQPQQYLFGDNVLVAPVTEAGTGTNRLGRQTVWFPEGAWYNFFTNERYDGEQQALVAADINEFPLYMRGGVPIPMRSFTQRMATDPLSEMIVRCYPGPEGRESSATLYEDDGLTNAYHGGASAQTKLTYSRKGQQIVVTISPVRGKFNGQVEQRSYVIELPALRAASKVMIDDAPASAEYVEAESLNRIKVPATSVGSGCVITVWADEVPPETIRSVAFAHRTGVATVATGPGSADLISHALEQAKNPADQAAICAAGGLGVFARNQNVYGYPALGTDQTFVPTGLNAQVQPIESTNDPLAISQTRAFKITLGGRDFTITDQPMVVDWSAQPGNIASAAHVTLSSGGPAKGLTDGRVDGYPGPRDAEWTTLGEKAGAWAKLEWPTPQTINRVILFDRPNPADHVTAGRIDFSDGSSSSFGALENDAAHGTAVQFPLKTIQWIKITLTAVSPETHNSGLAEVVILNSPDGK